MILCCRSEKGKRQERKKEFVVLCTYFYVDFFKDQTLLLFVLNILSKKEKQKRISLRRAWNVKKTETTRWFNENQIERVAWEVKFLIDLFNGIVSLLFKWLLFQVVRSRSNSCLSHLSADQTFYEIISFFFNRKERFFIRWVTTRENKIAFTKKQRFLFSGPFLFRCRLNSTIFTISYFGFSYFAFTAMPFLDSIGSFHIL